MAENQTVAILVMPNVSSKNRKDLEMKVAGVFFKANIAEGGKTQFGDFILFKQDCPMPLHKTLEHATFLIVTKLTTKIREGDTKAYNITNEQLVAIPYELIDSIAEVQGIDYYE